MNVHVSVSVRGGVGGKNGIVLQPKEETETQTHRERRSHRRDGSAPAKRVVLKMRGVDEQGFPSSTSSSFSSSSPSFPSKGARRFRSRSHAYTYPNSHSRSPRKRQRSFRDVPVYVYAYIHTRTQHAHPCCFKTFFKTLLQRLTLTMTQARVVIEQF